MLVVGNRDGRQRMLTEGSVVYLACSERQRKHLGAELKVEPPTVNFETFRENTLQRTPACPCRCQEARTGRLRVI